MPMFGKYRDVFPGSATLDRWLTCQILWSVAIAGVMVGAIRSQSGDVGRQGESSGGKAVGALRFRGEAILSVSWAADSNSLAMAGFGGPVRVWEMDSGRHWSLDEGGDVEDGGHRSTQSRVTSFSPDGRVLAVGNSSGEVAIRDVASRRKIASFRDGAEPILSMAWSPDARTLAWSKGGKIRSWKFGSGPVSTFAHWDSPSVKLTYSPDGRLIAGGGGDGMVRIWDLATGRERLSVRSHAHGIGGLAFTVDSRTVIACSVSGPSRLWDATSGEERRLTGDAFRSSAVAYSRDGGRLAFADRDGTIRIRDVTTGQEVGRFTGHSGTVATLAWSPDGHKFASAGYDGAAMLWDVSGIP
jgi:WD40 repeat protein